MWFPNSAKNFIINRIFNIFYINQWEINAAWKWEGRFWNFDITLHPKLRTRSGFLHWILLILPNAKEKSASRSDVRVLSKGYISELLNVFIARHVKLRSRCDFSVAFRKISGIQCKKPHLVLSFGCRVMSKFQNLPTHFHAALISHWFI